MHNRSTTIILVAIMGLASVAMADRAVTLNVQPRAMTTTAALTIGDFVSVDVFASVEGNVPLLGVEAMLACDACTLRITSIDVNPAFGSSLERNDITLPANRVRLVRSQALEGLDRSLGVDGEPVWYATLTLEALQPTTLEGALMVKARAALLGAIPEATVVVGEIVTDRLPLSTGPLAGGGPLASSSSGGPGVPEAAPPPPPDPWETETADLALWLTEVGGRTPVTELEPETTYELHYAAAWPQVNDYALYVVGDEYGQVLANAAPPGGGQWADPVAFAFFDLESTYDQPFNAPGYADGYERLQMIAAIADHVDTPEGARPVGHLCNFTTADPGPLDLQLIVWRFDVENEAIVEMEAVGAYDVVE